jgi:hypothetical protein
MNQQNVLVVSSARIDGPGIGSLFLNDIVRSLPQTHFNFIIVNLFWRGDGASQSGRVASILHTVLARSSLVQSLRLSVFRRFRLTQTCELVTEAALSQNARSIVVTATSPEIVAVAAKLAKQGHNIRVMVWDAPEFLASNLPLTRRQTKLHLKTFDQMMQNASALAVVSDAFKRHYQEKYQLPCEIIRHGIDLPEPLSQPKQRDEIRIAFAGSLYCKNEWNVFVDALAKCNWQINGKRIRLYFIGTFPRRGTNRPPEMEWLGQLSFNETLTTLSTMDIGYLPYWFAKNHELVARTSFPGKMSAYAAAGLAVFHHAPHYTEGTGFLSAYPFGVACASLDSKTVLASLEGLIGVMETTEFQAALREAWKNELSSRVMASRFQRFLAYGDRITKNGQPNSSLQKL